MNCLSAAANADGSYAVPIYHDLQYGSVHVLKIYAGLNGGPMVPFLLDSGSPNLFAAYGSWWPGSPTTVVKGTHRDKFSSGNEFFYKSAHATVTFGDRRQNAIAGIDAKLAMLTKATVKGETRDYRYWKKVNPFTETVLPNDTFGNMGLGLEGNSAVSGLATLAAQVPLAKGMQTGFVINTGGSLAARAQLTLGLSPGVVKMFQAPQAIVLQMGATGGTIPGPGGSTVPAYGEAQASATTLTVTNQGRTLTLALPTIFDTGGGNNTYINAAGTILDTGINYPVQGLSVSQGLRQVFDYVTSNPLGGGLYVTTGGGTDPRTNTGLSIFMQYLVLFNLTEGWMSLLPFSALNSVPFLSNDFTPASTAFIVSGPVTTSQSPVKIHSLSFDPGSSLEIANSLTVKSGNFGVANGAAAINGGALLVPGDLTKTGAGALAIASDVRVGGAAMIRAGGLVINQTLTAAQGTRVLPGAWLGGNGVIVGAVTNAGAVNPGNSPGALTIVGDFTQTSGGTLTIEAQSAAVYDRLLITGHA
ncbi:MAG TPA: hypothetical protein VIS74_07465, partial [Chthoniobacterales bacterium]